MAFSKGHASRKSDGWLTELQQEAVSSPFNTYMVTQGPSGARMSSTDGSDVRVETPRRSTMTSTMPAYSPYGQWQPAMTSQAENDIAVPTPHKANLYEKRIMELGKMREQRQRFEIEMRRIEKQQAKDAKELAEMTAALNSQISGGKKSEPTTPGEPRDAGFASAFATPNRYPGSSMLPPPGMPPLPTASSLANKRISQPSMMGPPSYVPSKIPSKSVPGSRRNSDETESDLQYVEEALFHRPAGAHNRNSMPASGLGSLAHGDSDSTAGFGFGQINTTKFLFGDEDSERSASRRDHRDSSSDVKSYLQMNATDDKFPILVRRDDRPGVLSASSTAVDLSATEPVVPDAQSGSWSAAGLHRQSQQSLPANALALLSGQADEDAAEPDNSMLHTTGLANSSPTRRVRFDRTLTDVPHATFAQTGHPVAGAAGLVNAGHASMPPKLQSSYSANDILTVRNTIENTGTKVVARNIDGPKANHQNGGMQENGSLTAAGPRARENHNNTADQMANRPGSGNRRRQSRRQGPMQVGQQVGPPMPAPMPMGFAPYGYPGFFGGFGMPMMGPNMPGMPGMPMMGPHMHPMPMGNPMFPMGPGFMPPSMHGGFGQASENRSRGGQPRRAPGEGNRFGNAKLETLKGEIYPMCKDQHGCRFLQQKLDERKPENIRLIFDAISVNMKDLMTDPFGNYLCQKLLEYADDEQRTVLVKNAAPDLAVIAFNQHGTRALQKMIDCVSTPEQIDTVVRALHGRVVELVQDINGNHVIQKCLNRLTSVNAEFIFEAVAENCVAIGTHRHGCCVLQRCVDHSTGMQKARLIRQISINAFSLIRDPFGNYVVQYILDMGDPNWTEGMCKRFLGSMATLSKHKFSSNVMEKCIRTASPALRQQLVEELIVPHELPKLVRDSYANYVVQTAIDWSDPYTKSRLVEAIRPLIPSLRNTPYGRRIAGKINAIEAVSTETSGQQTPAEGIVPNTMSPGLDLALVPATGPAKPTQSALNPLAGVFGPSKMPSTGGPLNVTMAPTTNAHGGPAFPQSNGLPFYPGSTNGMSGSGQRPGAQPGQMQPSSIQLPFVQNFSRPGNQGQISDNQSKYNRKKGTKGANGANGSNF